ncbi:MAG: PQQ-binding-like beta-propeller repeat protein [Caldiserica bacterium]|nr:PQQ-binding-like beta-propeller repeat protein [Caldisericota bacterium]
MIILASSAPTQADDLDLAPGKSTHKMSELWGRYEGRPVVLATFEDKALIFFPKSSFLPSKVALLDIETGEDLWGNVENDIKTFALDIAYIDSNRYLFDVSHDIIIFRPRTDSLVCFETNSGKKLWERRSGDHTFLPRFIDGDVAYENILNFHQYDDREFILISYNVVTGEILSELKLTDSELPKYSAFSGYVYGKIGNSLVMWDSENVELFDPVKKTFKHLINTELITYDTSLCVFGNIVVVDKNYFNPGYLYTKVVAVNADTGKEIWSNITCGEIFKLGNYVVMKRKTNDICELLFIEPQTGQIIQKFYDKSVDFINRNMESGILKVYYEYKVNRYKKRYVIRAFDKKMKELFCLDSDLSTVSTDGSFNYSSILDENHILLNSSKMTDGKKIDGFVCMKLFESDKAAAKLDQQSNVKDAVLLHSWQNLSVLAGVDENKAITNISCIDASTGEYYWTSAQSQLSDMLTGKKLDEVKLSCYENWICFYKFENGARSAMAGFNIQTGKQDWENKKLKDFELPCLEKEIRGYVAFTKEILPKEQRVYTISLDDGRFARQAKFDGQKASFEVLTGNDQRMIVFDGTLAMYHFRTGYQAWRLKTPITDIIRLRQSFICVDVFVRPGSDDAKTLAITGCDLYSGKTKWTIEADPLFANADNLVLATTGFETKADKTLLVIDANDGKSLKTTKFDNKTFEGFKVKQMFKVGDDYLVLAFKPGFGSRITSFDNNLTQKGLWDFEGKEIVKASQWFGCISVTFVDSSTNHLETVAYRLNYQ